MIIYITPEQWAAISDDFKAEHAQEHGNLKACFLGELTPAHGGRGANLCFEGRHFFVTDWRPERTEVERKNGGYAVKCLDSERAREFYAKGAVTVWEYPGVYDQGVELWSLYAYQWRNEYAEFMTERELERRLEELAEYEDFLQGEGGVHY